MARMTRNQNTLIKVPASCADVVGRPWAGDVAFIMSSSLDESGDLAFCRVMDGSLDRC